MTLTHDRNLITLGGVPFPASGAPYIVGVINVSPESPNADSIVSGSAGALARAAALRAGGARVMDIGGQSSHFRSPLVSEDEEIARLLPPLRELVGAGYLVSVDTWRAAVVRVAAANGAAVINDSDGFQDPEVIAAIAESGLPVILPFINGPNPRETQPFDDRAPMDVMLRWFDAA
ncbi:MAG: dihydropteroate synthase, partial [Dehalococcoidia bacterium]|nr:dihydropteroate synthase [Dehalococcoidia bacterium]